MPEFVLANALDFGWKFRPDPACFQSVYNRLKLLKLQTLRVGDDYKDYSTKTPLLERLNRTESKK